MQSELKVINSLLICKLVNIIYSEIRSCEINETINEKSYHDGRYWRIIMVQLNGMGSTHPPRTPQREKKPPMTLLHKLNLPDNVKHATYRYNENDIPITVMGIHYGFSIANAMVYGLLAEKCPKWRH